MGMATFLKIQTGEPVCNAGLEQSHAPAEEPHLYF